jgi:uncharacterized protein
MTRALYGLILVALALSVAHHVDHILRDDAGWPLGTDVNPFTYSLGVYPVILAGLVLSALGRVGPRFWAVLSLGGAVFVSIVHAGPVATDAVATIPSSYESPAAGALAVIVLVALVAVLVGTFGYEVRLSVTRGTVRDLRALVARHRLVAFVVVAYGFSWSWWLPLTLNGARVDFGVPSPAYVAGITGPLVAALVVTAVTDGRAGVRDLLGRVVRWRVAPRWYGITLLVLPGLFVVAASLLAVAGQSWPSLAGLGTAPGIPPAGVLVVWIYFVVVTGAGEETGWRGWALPHLQRRYSPLVASGVLSLIWAGWHLPVLPVLTSFDTLSGPALLPVFWFGLACLSIVLAWVCNRSGSILMPALWHGTYNLMAGTAAAQGGVNTILTVLVMAWAGGLVVMEVRARRAGRTGASPLAPSTSAPAPAPSAGPVISRPGVRGAGGSQRDGDLAQDHHGDEDHEEGQVDGH